MELCGRAGTPVPAEFAKPNASKYNARKKELDGFTFDSAGEAEAYRYLKRDESIGVIRNLELQPRYVLQVCTHHVTSDAIKRRTKAGSQKARNVVYVPDFRFLDQNGDTHVIDFKGFQTATYKVKRSIFREKYPNVIFEEWTRETLKELNDR